MRFSTNIIESGEEQNSLCKGKNQAGQTFLPSFCIAYPRLIQETPRQLIG